MSYILKILKENWIAIVVSTTTTLVFHAAIHWLAG